MALSSFTVTIITKSDSPFNVIPNAPIEIRERLANGSSGNLSLIFSDSAGLNPITQVGFTANSLGQATFFAAAADYNAVYDNNGTPVTIAVDVGVTGGILDERFDRLNPATVGIAAADSSVEDADTLHIKDRIAGEGGGGVWETVQASSVDLDTFDKVQAAGALAIVKQDLGSKRLENRGLGIGLNFMQQLNSNHRDVFMLVHSDSTANDSTEWPRLIATRLFGFFPEYTVLHYIWNESINDYDPPSNQGTGSGSNTLHIYNGSKGGASSEYYLYKQRPNAFGSRLFDLIIQSYGHNQGDTTINELTTKLAISTAQLIYDQPQAEIVLTIQNLWGDEQARSARHADSINRVANMFGCGIIDVRSVYLWKANTSDINEWLADGLHPNDVGKRVWADVVESSLLNPQKRLVSNLNSLADKNLSPVANTHFLNWDWVNNIPLGGWALADATATREDVIFETLGGSVKLTGTTTGTGFFIMIFDDYLQRADLSSGLTFMARVFYSSAWVSLEVSRIEVITNLGFERSAGRESNPVLEDGWAWRMVHIPASKLVGATSLDLVIWAGRIGDFVYVDRINVLTGLLPKEPLFRDNEAFLEYYFDDNVGSDGNNVITVTDDSVTHDSNSGGGVQWFINFFGVEVGEEYTFIWTYAGIGTNGGVLFREGLNDSGTVIFQQNDISLNKATFRATKKQGSIQIFNVIGAVPYTLDDIKLVKGRV